MAYVGNATEPDDWRRSDKMTAGYWCLKTMRLAGPDDQPALPERCQPGRTCYNQIDLV